MNNNFIDFKRILGLLIIFAAFLYSGGLYAQNSHNEYNIAITSPVDSSKVGRDVTVSGTAILPPGKHVWALARREDFLPLWWPQREVKVDLKTNQWKTTVVLGQPRDVDWYFDIGIVAVDAEGHQKLQEYWVEAMRTNIWNPIELPENSEQLKTIKAKKIRH